MYEINYNYHQFWISHLTEYKYIARTIFECITLNILYIQRYTALNIAAVSLNVLDIQDLYMKSVGCLPKGN